MALEPLSVPVHDHLVLPQTSQNPKKNFNRVGILPYQDRRAILHCIRQCGKQKNLRKGSKIHNDAIQMGFDSDVVVGSALISMYSKCGALEEAEDLFAELSPRDAVSCTSLIAGYTQHGLYDKALFCYQNMEDDGFYPDAVTYACVLKACGGAGLIHKGEEIHAKIRKQGLLEKHVILANALVNMYAKCSELAKAQDVFDKLNVRDLVSWNALVAGYAQHELIDEALSCVSKMEEDGFTPDAVTFACVVRACGNMGLIQNAEKIHKAVNKLGLLKHDVLLGTMLVDMFAKCSVPEKARMVFDELPYRDVVAWNVLIAGFAQHGLSEEAVACMSNMQDEGLSPDAVTCSCVLKACSSLGLHYLGEEIHAEITKKGLLGNNIVLGTALIDMYAKCGALGNAQYCFDKLRRQDLTSWNTLIAGYANHGNGDEAVKCFEQMKNDGISPDAVSFACTLKACGSIGLIGLGESIHAEIKKQGLLVKNVILGTALVDMYTKCGTLDKAQDVLDELYDRDLASWTALIDGYAQHGLGNEALDCFNMMLSEGLKPDAVTYACVLRACGAIGSIKRGEEIHVMVNKQELSEGNVTLSIALIDMYAKCSDVAKAQEVFDEIRIPDITAWTALIGGYAQLGQIDNALSKFCEMIAEDVVPNEITFLILLNTCSHAGMAEEGEMFFTIMNSIYYLNPVLEHLTCMVDLFSRAGFFNKAFILVKKSEYLDRLPLWSALLGSCKKWGNVQYGRLAFEQLVQLDDSYAPAYICMSNMYANAGMQDEAKKVETLRMQIERESIDTLQIQYQK